MKELNTSEVLFNRSSGYWIYEMLWEKSRVSASSVANYRWKFLIWLIYQQRGLIISHIHLWAWEWIILVHLVKLLKRTIKRLCYLFTCLTTRAKHIEVVRSLDTVSRLVAINRFISRRGKPATIISDIGTQFVGSAKELKEYINSWNKDQITSDLAQKNIVWKFNPPCAPHFAGVWEKLVRSCKKTMVSILGNRSLTDEVLMTTMCLVEQTLNARPLNPASDDSEDLEALTPNIFILGRASVCIPFYSQCRSLFKPS